MEKVNNKRTKSKGDNQYSTEYILERLRMHMVDDKKSMYTMTKPTHYGILKRIKNGDKDLERGVREIEAEHFAVYEQRLIGAVFEGMELDTVAFNIATRNKKPFLSYEVIELNERLEELENAQSKK